MPLLLQMDALLELRQRLRADPSLPPGTKLTFLPFFIKASGALVGWLVGCHQSREPAQLPSPEGLCASTDWSALQ